MLSGVCIGTDDLENGIAFYDRVLATVGMERLKSDTVEAGYGAKGGSPVFWVLLPFNKKDASVGNGTQVMFKAEDRDRVHRFYDTVIELGGTDEGPPGPRAYSDGYYGAYCRDPIGNKLHVFHLPD